MEAENLPVVEEGRERFQPNGEKIVAALTCVNFKWLLV